MIFGVLTLLSSPAVAQFNGPNLDNLATVSFIGGADFNAQNQTTLGLDIHLKDGWKTYWRIPGDAGLPPQMNWAGSENLESSPQILWPAPKRFEGFGLQNIGYGEHVVFPLIVTAKNADVPVTLQLQLSLLVCSDICVPFHTTLSYTLPAQNKEHNTQADILKDIPVRRDDIPLQDIAVTFAPKTTQTAAQYNLALVFDWPTDLKDKTVQDIFIDNAQDLFFNAPKIAFQNTAAQRHFLSAQLPLVSTPDDTASLIQHLENDSQFAAVITFKDHPAIVVPLSSENAIPLLPADETNTAQSAVQNAVQNTPTLLTILLFAFIGGAILNIMPCVLPVLSLKFLSLISASKKTKQHIRKGFLTSAFGILVAFWAMAGALSVLKIGGHAIGWGMQFQQTEFLIFMCAVLLLFGLNLWNVFQIQLPQSIMRKIPTVSDNGFWGHFSMGVFATLLATPCSAPFLGTAIGFALSQGTAQIFMIFTVLGLGLATPYLMVAALPQMAQHMPKPGAWMEIVKKTLGTALFITAIWLGSIVVMNIHGRAEQNSIKMTGVWTKFAPETIQQHIKDGKIVFVDITAEWCLTCKANKRLVLSTDAIQKLLSQDNVIAMQGDWTQMDDSITNYINSFGRYGIPLNVIYGPKATQGIALPELLRKDSVTSAFDTVK